MANVHINEVVGTVRLVDGESLLSPAVLERIVEAVLEAARAQRRDEESRRRDTRIGLDADEEGRGDRR